MSCYATGFHRYPASAAPSDPGHQISARGRLSVYHNEFVFWELGVARFQNLMVFARLLFAGMDLSPILKFPNGGIDAKARAVAPVALLLPSRTLLLAQTKRRLLNESRRCLALEVPKIPRTI